jgi:7,8-dihydro-6-hydroxymethylpterin dimethyltransferase
MRVFRIHREKIQPGFRYGVDAEKDLASALPEVVDFGSERGLSVFETTDIARYFEDFKNAKTKCWAKRCHFRMGADRMKFMTFNPTLWHRLEFDRIPVFIREDKAEWFVPNTAGDRILNDPARTDLNGDIEARRFVHRLPDSPGANYPGRAKLLETGALKEIWFHMTNRCNLLCTHCLFSASSDEKDEMPATRIGKIADEAARLGCRVFALTGGEPFVHREFEAVVNHLLSIDNSHVVVLTNGMGIDTHLEKQNWDYDRFHLQISLDGLGEKHDAIRGHRSFEKLTKTLSRLKEMQSPFTLSMCVNRRNIADMAALVDFAADTGAKNVHYMWYFVRGRGTAAGFVPPDEIFDHLVAAAHRARHRDVAIDNIEALKTQVFAPPGTIHDGTTAAWESLAVGPDGKLYPSAALVGTKDLGVSMDDGLETAWKKSSILENIRQQTAARLTHPMRYLLGGGDTDHSYINTGKFMGGDPYTPLYEQIALWLITQQATKQRESALPELKLKMGDILESCGAHGSVALVHSNCLLSVARKNSLSIVKAFYSDAAQDTREDILNPVCYDADLIAHIPEQFRFRGYGCGSPVTDAGIRPGESVADLGCGGGVECFIASKLSGQSGRVVGIDMLDPMLLLARKAMAGVTENLGFGNVSFKKGYLEKLPLGDDCMDAVLSNCVMNLSVNKRKAYAEIFRVLRAGGRLVISDVVCDTEPDPAIRNDELLRGECIAGAMTQKDLMGILHETGFESIRLIKRFPYRTVSGHPFFSLTYEARKPKPSDTATVIYRGPLKAGLTFDGNLLLPGVARTLSMDQAKQLGDTVFILDKNGAVTNMGMEDTCACADFSEPAGDCCGGAGQSVPGSGILSTPPHPLQTWETGKSHTGCMKCGSPLVYTTGETKCTCIFCKTESKTNVRCEQGHHVCDACHSKEALPVIEHLCLSTRKTDMIELFEEIRRHPAIPVHGPEHHIMVPGIILATYRNLGGNMSMETVAAGISRGATVPGGYCGFMGICGAAVGVGIAFSLILEANPIKPVERKIVQSVTAAVLADIAVHEAARCCQRDAWIALKKAAVLSETVLPIPLKADNDLVCSQQGKIKECIRQDCPLWPVNTRKGAGDAD